VPGTQAGLFCALSATINAGDRVAILDPDYMCLEPMLRFCGAEVTHIGLHHACGSATVDIEALRAFARDGGRAFAFTNPNNPTGVVLDLGILREIAAICGEHDLLAIVDELYCRCVFDGVKFHHLVSLPGMRQRTLTLLGPSKTEQMSGYRVGVVVAPEPITKVIAEVLSVTAIRAPAYSQHALAGWLGDDEAYVASLLQEYVHVRQIAHEALSALPFVRVSLPQATPYTFPSVRQLGRADLAVARALLTEADVLITPGYEFGPRGVGSFRICFAQDAGVLRSALERIATTLSELAAAPVSTRTAV
jgi:aspartate/methionine/tyrosine aminotransferase